MQSLQMHFELGDFDSEQRQLGRCRRIGFEMGQPGELDKARPIEERREREKG